VNTRFKREYTDHAVLICPNIRWAQEDFRDLERWKPEVFLGLQVHLTTPDYFQRDIRGLWVTKFVVSDETFSNTGWYRYHNEMYWAMARYEWAKIEVWHIHRVEGIWQVVQ
jgi:hypothetical protein